MGDSSWIPAFAGNTHVPWGTLTGYCQGGTTLATRYKADVVDGSIDNVSQQPQSPVYMLIGIGYPRENLRAQ